MGSLGVFGLEAVADTHIYAMPLPLPQPAKRNTAAIARAWLFGDVYALALKLLFDLFTF